MTTRPSMLLTAEHTDVSTPELMSTTTIFRTFDQQDSGCVSYGVCVDGRQWFVKTSTEPRAVSYLKNAVEFHRRVRHPRIPSLLNSITTYDGLALVYQWVDGEVLGSPEYRGAEGRSRPESPHYRFLSLPVDRRLDVLDRIFEVHVHTEREGYVAVDFYDGCVLYDFERHRVHLCDFDHYHPGPFVMEDQRLPGSSRFMAPEEFQNGSVIDQRTNVYTMGAAAFVFLAGARRCRKDWEGPGALWDVASRAVSLDPEERYWCVEEYFGHWQKAR